MVNLLVTLLLLLLVVVLSIISYKIYLRNLPKQKCMVLIKSEGNNKINGKIYFSELDNFHVKVYGKIEGLKPGKHGIHIHESGDLSKGCTSLRGHFNPNNKLHGPRVIPGTNITNKNRHVGDLGNIEANDKGIAEFSFIDDIIRLRGKYCIIGRSVIVHEGEDDLGFGNSKDSLITGNSGARVACGIIGIA